MAKFIAILFSGLFLGIWFAYMMVFGTTGIIKTVFDVLFVVYMIAAYTIFIFAVMDEKIENNEK